MLKIVFFGSSPLSVVALDYLYRKSREYDAAIVGVVTKSDVKVGKKRILTKNPVKVWATEHNIQVCDSKKDAKSFLEMTNADLAVVMAYGHIIKSDVLATPKYGFLNIHGSILPHLRGAIPIQMAIFEGLTESGVTIIKMNEGLDTGAILSLRSIKILPEDNFKTYGEKIAIVGGEILLNSLGGYIDDKTKLQVQDDTQATLCTIKDIEKIEHPTWEFTSKQIANAVRALAPYEHPRITINGIEILLYQVSEARIKLKKGEWLSVKENGIRNLFVGCAEGALLLSSLQPIGKNIMTGADFWNGYLKS